MPVESSLAHSFPAPKRSNKGPGPSSAGQSGDTQGLSESEDLGEESIKEMIEEGQSFEASILAGVAAADASDEEVHTKELLEDDIPAEYRDAAEPPRSTKNS